MKAAGRGPRMGSVGLRILYFLRINIYTLTSLEQVLSTLYHFV